jgi:hypothetical protein
VIASAVILLLFWQQLEPVGRGLIIAVAIAVEGFATLQFSAARRSTGAMPGLPAGA